ncbi:MAG: hypothetical protein ABJE95_30700 [Byssovorax sp.]
MRFFTWTTLTVLTCAGCGSSVGPTGSGGSAPTSSSSATGATTGGSGGATSTATGSGGSSGSTASASSAASSSTGASSSGAGGAPSGSGDCTTDAQCPGSKCVAIFPGGFRVCADVLVEATTCNQKGVDQCCGATMPCPGGQPCYAGPLEPYCGGVPMLPHNECAVDQCTSDASCGAGNACLVSGVLGRKERACFPAPCKHDGECVDAAGGSCAPVADPCCGQAATLYCIYPGDCRSNADCGNGYCVIDPAKKRAACVAKSPICPA